MRVAHPGGTLGGCQESPAGLFAATRFGAKTSGFPAHCLPTTTMYVNSKYRQMGSRRTTRSHVLQWANSSQQDQKAYLSPLLIRLVSGLSRTRLDNFHRLR